MPMLREAAEAFEQLVKNPTQKGLDEKGQITWSNTVQVQAYIDRLQAAAERITSENSKLRKYHVSIGERVVQLKNISLLKNQEIWKEIVKEIRSIFDSLDSQGYKDMRAWKTHWDHQLYKALEYQYKLGLESLNETLTDINVELVFKHQQLQFRPPFEEIRAKYYSIIKKFIKFPANFQGVGDSEIFKVIHSF